MSHYFFTLLHLHCKFKAEKSEIRRRGRRKASLFRALMIVPRPQISRGGLSARTRRHGRSKGTARATGAFEGPPPEECAVKPAQSEPGAGTARLDSGEIMRYNK